MLRTSLGLWCFSRRSHTCRSRDSLFNRRSTQGIWIASSMCRLPVLQGRSGTRARNRCIRRLDNHNSCRASTTLLRGGALGGGGGGYIGHVPQDPVPYSKATWATLRRAQDVFNLPLRNGICIRQLQGTAHIITMHMSLTQQMPESFFPSSAAANVPHDVVHNKFMALMQLQEGTCPFRRMVSTGAHTGHLLVLFGGQSAEALTHVSYLSFSADGLHRRLQMTATCPFRRMVCSGVYTGLLPVLFGGWSAHATCPTCPFRRMVCIGRYTPTCPFRRRMVCTAHLGKCPACPTRRDGLFHQMSSVHEQHLR